MRRWLLPDLMGKGEENEKPDRSNKTELERVPGLGKSRDNPHTRCHPLNSWKAGAVRNINKMKEGRKGQGKGKEEKEGGPGEEEEEGKEGRYWRTRQSREDTDELLKRGNVEEGFWQNQSEGLRLYSSDPQLPQPSPGVTLLNTIPQEGRKSVAKAQQKTMSCQYRWFPGHRAL